MGTTTNCLLKRNIPIARLGVWFGTIIATVTCGVRVK